MPEEKNDLAPVLASHSVFVEQTLVLICWERINAAPKQLGLEDHLYLPLLDVAAFHEHSHAARESKLLQGANPDILHREETIAQEETYMFLRTRSRDQREAIEAMKKLMEKQPECYHIRIP